MYAIRVWKQQGSVVRIEELKVCLGSKKESLENIE